MATLFRRRRSRRNAVGELCGHARLRRRIKLRPQPLEATDPGTRYRRPPRGRWRGLPAHIRTAAEKTYSAANWSQSSGLEQYLGQCSGITPEDASPQVAQRRGLDRASSPRSQVCGVGWVGLEAGRLASSSRRPRSPCCCFPRPRFRGIGTRRGRGRAGGSTRSSTSW